MDTQNTQTQENTQTTPVVEIYSTATCHFCHMAKDWMAAKNVAFKDYNVGEDMVKRKEMVEMTGQLGVPVIKIGNDVMVGFNQDKMAELLGIAA